MTTQRLGNEGSLRPSKQMRACYFLLLQDQIFRARCSQFPRGSLKGVMFCALSSVWDKWKTFWLSLQGETASREELWAMLSRTLDASNGERKREKGGNINKTIFSHYNTLFLFCIEEPACHFSSQWFDVAAFATVAHNCMLLPSLNVTFFMTFHNVTYLPVEIMITVAYCKQCFVSHLILRLKAVQFFFYSSHTRHILHYVFF